MAELHDLFTFVDECLAHVEQQASLECFASVEYSSRMGSLDARICRRPVQSTSTAWLAALMTRLVRVAALVLKLVDGVVRWEEGASVPCAARTSTVLGRLDRRDACRAQILVQDRKLSLIGFSSAGKCLFNGVEFQ